MFRHLFCICSLLIAVDAFCQSTPTRDERFQLNCPRTVRNEYVNFEVIKLMFGHGWSGYANTRAQFAANLNVQILSPWALLKKSKFIHIAWGYSSGSRAIAFNNASFIFDDYELKDIQPDNKDKYELQRTRYRGFVILPFMQFGEGKKFTVMVGSGLHFNSKSQHYVNNGITTQKFILDAQIKKTTIPLNFQFSYKIGEMMIGTFYSQDLNSRFKGNFDLKQHVAGISVGLII